MSDGIFEKGTHPREVASVTAKRLQRERCAECGRRLWGELRNRRADGKAVCLRMDCQRCFGCEGPLTEEDIEYALDRGGYPLYCVDCRRRDRFNMTEADNE